MAYLQLTLAHSKGQGHGHAHFDCKICGRRRPAYICHLQSNGAIKRIFDVDFCRLPWQPTVHSEVVLVVLRCSKYAKRQLLSQIRAIATSECIVYYCMGSKIDKAFAAAYARQDNVISRCLKLSIDYETRKVSVEAGIPYYEMHYAIKRSIYINKWLTYSQL